MSKKDLPSAGGRVSKRAKVKVIRFGEDSDHVYTSTASSRLSKKATGVRKQKKTPDSPKPVPREPDAVEPSPPKGPGVLLEAAAQVEQSLHSSELRARKQQRKQVREERRTAAQVLMENAALPAPRIPPEAARIKPMSQGVSCEFTPSRLTVKVILNIPNR